MCQQLQEQKRKSRGARKRERRAALKAAALRAEDQGYGDEPPSKKARTGATRERDETEGEEESSEADAAAEVDIEAESEKVSIQKLGRAIRPLSRILQHPLEYPQKWVLAWPMGMEKKEREAVLADLADLRAEPMEVVEHAVGAPFEGPYCWVIFLDSQGVMRAAAESVDPRLHSKVQKWSRKFRRRR